MTLPSDQVAFEALALGCYDNLMCSVQETILLHPEVVKPWQALVNAAAREGFELALVSGYRSFERQLAIWNGKLLGQRPVLDDDSCDLDISCLSSIERIRKVMRWSALPGASRHHWGSDMDIYDRAAVTADYQLQLVAAEYQDDGPFAPMITWLKNYLQQHKTGFFMPYTEDHGGVMPEPWHLSYQPLAQQCQQHWHLSIFKQQLLKADLQEKETVLGHLDELYQQFISPSLMAHPD